MSTAKKMTIDTTTYLEGEKIAEYKNEYLRGEVFAMVGVSNNHAVISGNIFGELWQKLKGKPCQPFIGDMKVHVAKADAYFYPDVFVTCHPDDKNEAHDYFKEHPSLIVEVLSKSTEAFDRGEKFACYRMLDSLKEYWLVDPKRLSIDQFVKDDNGTWRLSSYACATDHSITADSLNGENTPLKLAIDDIFEGVKQDSAASGSDV
jgi:Uma2 family endonuclease